MKLRITYLLSAIFLCTNFGWGNPGTATDDPKYYPGDIAVINAMIDNNGLPWTKAVPADGSYVPGDWNGIGWDYQTKPLRIQKLYLTGLSLTGSLDVSGLTNLYEIHCYYNSLTALNASGLANLQMLFCQNNNLTTLDVSSLTNLQRINCSNNSLTDLNVSGLTKLYELNCSNNSLITLDVSGLTNLMSFDCYNNSLTALDVSGLTNLMGLNCRHNSLTVLDVSSGLTNLKSITCDYNNLITLDVSRLADLQGLTCSNNSLTVLDVSNFTNLQTLECDYNNLTVLDVSRLTNLQDLKCYGNSLTELDVHGLTNLRYLDCSNNSLTELNVSLDVSGYTNLQQLYCHDNSLTTLYVSELTNLQRLACHKNNLTVLNVSNLTNLQQLWCHNNSLTTLDVSRLTNLQDLRCSGNSLTALDTRGLTNLQQLFCDNNNLTTLYVSPLANLRTLSCSRNSLTTLYVSPLTNLQWLLCDSNKLTFLDLTGIESLTRFTGSGQTPSFELTGKEGNYTTNATFAIGTTFNNTALTYDNGVLKSTSDAVTTSRFVSKIAPQDSNRYLTGTLTLTYSTVTTPVTGISLNLNSLTMDIDSNEQLIATVFPEDATNKNVIWESSETTVATVSATGLVTAVGEGTATITVTTEDGDFSASCIVTVSRALSSDATLSVITIDAGALSPTFSPSVTQYTVNVENEITTIDLSATANDAAATVSGTGTKSLNVGDNVFNITVTAENGEQQVYTVTVNRAEPPTIAVTGIDLDQTSVSIWVGESTQLTATVLPTDAANQNVTWSSSVPSVATVSNTGLITAVGKGTATITAVTEEGGFTASCVVEALQQDVTVTGPDSTQTGAGGKGVLVLSLTIPADVLFSGSFLLTLPDGVQLDLSATRLAGDLASRLTLDITQNADGSWLFTITPQALRSASESVYSQIIEIGYTVDETAVQGTYEATIRGLSFAFDNGTTITADEIPVQITINSPTGISGGKAGTDAYLFAGRLYVNSSVAETIQVYSIEGIRLCHFQKPAGEAIYRIDQVKGSGWIVKGGSGWVKKLIMN